MLTWSKGLRAAVDLDVEQSDEQVVEGEEQQEAEIVAVLKAGAWDGARDRYGLPCAILEAAERAIGPAEGYEAIENLLRGRSAPWDGSA